MVHIPVSFEHEGKMYKGYLSEVAGAASAKKWHLMIDYYYYGSLLYLNDKWVFHGSPGSESMNELADYFGEVVIAWYE